MSETCQEPWPQDETITCDKPPHPFGSHFNFATTTVWDGLPTPTRTRKGNARIAEIINAMDASGAGVKTGPPKPLRPTRHADPQTSHDAAASTTEDRLRESQQAVLDLFTTRGDMSDEGLLQAAQEAGVKQSESGLRTRRSELVGLGLLVDTGARTRTVNDRQTVVWGVPG